MRFVLLFLCVTAVLAERKRYDGYNVLEITPATRGQHDYVHSLQSDVELDFWTERQTLGQPSLVMVPPHRLVDIYTKLNSEKIKFTIFRENVQEGLDAEQERLAKRSNTEPFMDFNDYQRYETIMDEMEVLAADCSALAGFECSTYIAGVSEEGRDIKVLHIDGPGTTAIWLDSLIHAREWLAGATLLKITDHLIRNYGTDGTAASLMDANDWYIMPVMNPDGYIFSWDVDRMWRKNRGENEGEAEPCWGTDLNRNFDIYWGSDGTSTNPCSSTYGGPSPASAIETQVAQDELVAHSSEVNIMLTIHTAAEMWLHPWGHTEDGQCVIAETHDEMFRVANAAADATENTHGVTEWTRGNTCDVIYPASGITSDYAYGVAGIPYSYTPELRGPGFDPPATDIEPSFEETWNGLVALIDAVENP